MKKLNSKFHINFNFTKIFSPYCFSSALKFGFNFFVILQVILLINQSSGAGECQRLIGGRKLNCYDCDSRYDENCGSPFNKTLPMDLKPPMRECFGCCLKITHKFPKTHKKRPGEEWIQRTCTENIIINYFMVDHVCMSEGKGHGKMCFCEYDLCNGTPSKIDGSNNCLLSFLLFIIFNIKKSFF